MCKILIIASLVFLPHVLFSQEQTMGLFFTSEEAFEGYTLFSNNKNTYLIDNCGFVVNEWQSDYKPGQGVYLTDTGDLLRAGSIPGAFNAGGRGGIIELFDWYGNLKWTYSLASENLQAHHDLALLPNGNFLCTVWEKMSEEQAKSKGRIFDGELWSERILEIKMLENDHAQIVWEWSVWDHLIQDQNPELENYGVIAEHPELLDINYVEEGQATSGNWLHLNSIAYNAQFDQIIISSRNLSELYVIDHSTSSAEAASHEGGIYGHGGDFLYRYGNPQTYDHGSEADRQLRRQHDARWIAEGLDNAGAFIVFNNEYEEGQQSAVQIFNNPATTEGHYYFDTQNKYGNEDVIRQYTHPEMYSDILSGAEVLPNGNLLILEGRKGHLYEINSTDEIVWQYVNPVNQNGGPGIQGAEPRFNLLFRAKRYATDHPAFNGVELLASAPIEISPLEKDCGEIPELPQEFSDLQLLKNPIQYYLHLHNPNNFEVKASLFSANGIELLKINSQPGENNIPVFNLPPGFYILNPDHPTQEVRAIKLIIY